MRELGQELKDGTIDNLQELILKIIGSDYFLESIYGKDISKNESVEVISYTSVDSIYDSFGKCSSCHLNNDYNFFDGSGFPIASNSPPTCQDKKSVLEDLRNTSYQINGGSSSNNKTLVTHNSICDSNLYLNLSASKAECGHTTPPNAWASWMNDMASEWNEVDDQNIKDFINGDYSCED